MQMAGHGGPVSCTRLEREAQGTPEGGVAFGKAFFASFLMGQTVSPGAKRDGGSRPEGVGHGWPSSKGGDRPAGQ
jgi:hypothetical protein